MKHYYETTRYDAMAILEGKDITVNHDTLESAIDWAESHDIEVIQEVGGSWDQYKKCWFCGEWFPTSELKDDTCSRCEMAIWAHEGK